MPAFVFRFSSFGKHFYFPAGLRQHMNIFFPSPSHVYTEGRTETLSAFAFIWLPFLLWTHFCQVNNSIMVTGNSIIITFDSALCSKLSFVNLKTLLQGSQVFHCVIPQRFRLLMWLAQGQAAGQGHNGNRADISLGFPSAWHSQDFIASSLSLHVVQFGNIQIYTYIYIQISPIETFTFLFFFFQDKNAQLTSVREMASNCTRWGLGWTSG